MVKDRDPAYREVYSTEIGAVCPGCGQGKSRCSCASEKRAAIAGDGNVKVRRETKGRGGKTVTTVTGLALNEDQLRELLTALKKRNGVGGSVKDGALELQGDLCESVLSELSRRGIKAKRAGG